MIGMGMQPAHDASIDPDKYAAEIEKLQTTTQAAQDAIAANEKLIGQIAEERAALAATAKKAAEDRAEAQRLQDLAAAKLEDAKQIEKEWRRRLAACLCRCQRRWNSCLNNKFPKRHVLLVARRDALAA